MREVKKAPLLSSLTDADSNKVPGSLGELEEAWYLDGSNVVHNNQGRKLMRCIVVKF